MPDRYAGLAGLTVAVVDGMVVLDVSTVERPEHIRLRIDPDTALTLADALIDHAEQATS